MSTDAERVAHSESIRIDATPAEVYDLVSDITRTGEWSVGCERAEWDDRAVTGLGAGFTGHNVFGEREWQTHCTVVAADPGGEFAWETGDGWARWGYRMREADGGTELAHDWEYLPAGREFWGAKHGERAQEQLEIRVQAAREGMPRTLAAIKRILEESDAPAAQPSGDADRAPTTE